MTVFLWYYDVLLLDIVKEINYSAQDGHTINSYGKKHDDNIMQWMNSVFPDAVRQGRRFVQAHTEYFMFEETSHSGKKKKTCSQFCVNATVLFRLYCAPH